MSLIGNPDEFQNYNYRDPNDNGYGMGGVDPQPTQAIIAKQCPACKSEYHTGHIEEVPLCPDCLSTLGRMTKNLKQTLLKWS